MSTSFPESLELPFEITELIINELADEGDKHTLRNLALVSSACAIACQKKLFNTVDLGDRCISGDEYYRRFHRILSQRPNFRYYIREFRLVDSFVWDRTMDWKWLVKEDSIIDVLDLLPRLRSFSLTFNTNPAPWDAIRPSVRRALIALAKRPGIQSYSLSRVRRFPPSLLLAWCGREQLGFNDVEFQMGASATLDSILALSNAPRPYLRTLLLRSPKATTVDLLRKVLSSYPTATLTTLVVTSVDEKDVKLAEALWKLIQWAAPTLAHLEWRPSSHTKTRLLHPPDPISLSVLETLRTLRFVVNFHSDDGPVFEELLAMLNQVSSAFHFKELIIDCMFVNVAELVARASDWALLDQMLTRPDFCHMKQVVYVLKRKVVRASKGDPKITLMEELPLARSRGVQLIYILDLPDVIHL